MKRRRGVTIIEMLLSLTMLSIVMASVTALVRRSQIDYTRQRDVVRTQENIRAAELVITRLLRSGAVDPMSTAVGRIDINPLGRPALDNIRVRSDYNPADGDVLDPLEDALVYTSGDTLYVRWQAAAQPQALAYPVRSVVFEYFTEAGVAVTTQAAFPTAATAKYTVTAPIKPGSSTLKRRSSWVYFRN